MVDVLNYDIISTAQYAVKNYVTAKHFVSAEAIDADQCFPSLIQVISTCRLWTAQLSGVNVRFEKALNATSYYISYLSWHRPVQWPTLSILENDSYYCLP